MRALLRQALSRFHFGVPVLPVLDVAAGLDPQVCLCDPGPTNQDDRLFPGVALASLGLI